MAAVLEKKDPASPYASQVDEQLAQATSRIRTHDLAFGGLLLVALVLIYATTMIVLDKSFTLPEWVRQMSLAGFIAILGSAAYFTLIRPLRKQINPLYAAKQVENTLEDNKNSVTGYVDAQEKGDLNPTVKAALASRAAKAAAEADVNRAVDHRNLAYIGAVAVVFLLTLIVLFFVFRPAQFASLVNRTFNPFASTVIASKTEITIMKPEPVEPTITTGQSITVAVHISGKVPSSDDPDRVRLMIRHNPADPNYDELPMVQGETSRDWELRVPDYLVQNGFWYKVAAGDAMTQEYRVTVRSIPAFTEFQAKYDYPKYFRRQSETANDAVISGYRGTQVTLVAKANRDLRDGLMVIEPSNTRVPGVLVPGKPDSLQFVFKLTESGRYKLSFTATNGETTPTPFTAAIKVEADRAPQIIITKPEDPQEGTELQVPANGQIAIDGKIGDDFGIDTVTLKMKVVEPPQHQRPLPEVPYLNGKSTSFHRAKDDTWPTDLDYKGSIDLTKLTEDAAKLPFKLEPDMVIEFWLEATDNCTEPKPNVGRSQPKRVRLVQPQTNPMDKQQTEDEKQARQKEEKQHNDQQKEKLDNEKREPKQGEKKANQQGKQNEQNKNENNKDPNNQNKDPDNKQGDNKQSDNKNQGNNQQGNNTGEKDPNAKPEPKDPMGKGGSTDMNSQSKPNDMNENAEKDFQKQIEEENKDGGSSKPNPTPKQEERQEPGKAKPQPKEGTNGANANEQNNASQPKPDAQQPKEPNDPMNNNPMGKNNDAPSQSKSEGKLEKGQDPATTKPEPKQTDGTNGSKQDKGNAPSENREKPAGGQPGAEKETPKDPQPAPSDPNQKQDPNSGSTGKPSTQQPQDGNSGMPNANEKQDPAANAGQSKPMREPTRGDDKPQAKQEPSTKSDGKPEGNQQAGSAKPDKAPPEGAAKPTPKNETNKDDMNSAPKPAEGANDTQKPNGTKAADSKPDNTQKQPMGANEKSVDKGIDKPQAGKNDKTAGNSGGGGNDQKKELSPEEKKNLEEAAKNLNSPDQKKREDAQKTLDKAIGEEKRKELEQLSKDLNSSDQKTREDAKQKLEQLAKDAQKNGQKQGDPNGKKELSPEEKKKLEEAAKNLNSPDQKKKEDAQKTLDKAIGEEKRKELEQLSKDLNSSDQKTREDAKQKLEQLAKDAQKNQQKQNDPNGKKQPGDNANASKPDDKQQSELGDAMKDLQSNDPNKKKEAQQKLDKALGQQNRKQIEEMMKDLNSDDPQKKATAEQRLKDIKDQLQEQEEQARKDRKNDKGDKSEPKGKEPSQEEIADLMNKAKDLNSKDDKTREQAEKDLDKKIGEENRKKLQEQMKNQKPQPQQQEDDLKQKMKEWQEGLGRSTESKGPMDEDKRNRLKTAELNLKKFESDEYREKLKASKGWTDKQYDDFLKDMRERIGDMKDNLSKNEKPSVAPPPSEPNRQFSSPGSGMVEGANPTTGTTTTGGATVAPPGFENAKSKFQDALKGKK